MLQIMHAGLAKFRIAGQIAGQPVIHDLGGPRSVTNEAELVVQAVLARFGHAPHIRAIIYRDSVGVFDAMRIEGGHFAEFIIADASSDAEAFNRIADALRRPPASAIAP